MTKIHWFWLFKYEYLLIFSLLYDNKLKIFSVCDPMVAENSSRCSLRLWKNSNEKVCQLHVKSLQILSETPYFCTLKWLDIKCKTCLKRCAVYTQSHNITSGETIAWHFVDHTTFTKNKNSNYLQYYALVQITVYAVCSWCAKTCSPFSLMPKVTLDFADLTDGHKL